MAQWLEVSMSVDGEAAEVVAELLARYGYKGVAIEHEGIPPDKLDEDEIPPARWMTVRAYFPVNLSADDVARQVDPDDQAWLEEYAANVHSVDDVKMQLETALRYMNMMYPMPTPSYKVVDEQDWAEAWKAHYKPVRIGGRLLIRPAWVELDLQPGDLEIALDPGMAFGTGTHPTTQLCLESLEALTPPGAQVLDLGCGSGILTIAAAKLGAAHVLALDIDPVAVEVTQENIVKNGVADKVTVGRGSLESVVSSARRFDLIVVNILARIIIQMCDEHLGETVRPGGLGIFSGIIAEQADDVEAALRKAGLEPYKRRQQGDWVAIEARRPHSQG